MVCRQRQILWCHQCVLSNRHPSRTPTIRRGLPLPSWAAPRHRQHRSEDVRQGLRHLAPRPDDGLIAAIHTVTSAHRALRGEPVTDQQRDAVNYPLWLDLPRKIPKQSRSSTRRSALVTIDDANNTPTPTTPPSTNYPTLLPDWVRGITQPTPTGHRCALATTGSESTSDSTSLTRSRHASTSAPSKADHSSPTAGQAKPNSPARTWWQLGCSRVLISRVRVVELSAPEMTLTELLSAVCQRRIRTIEQSVTVRLYYRQS